MEKLNITIINNTNHKTVHIAVDHGIFQSIESNSIIVQLLRIIHNPEKYNIEFFEV